MYQLVSEMFYPELVQAVLTFGSETWVLLEEIARALEGVYLGFLSQVMVNAVIQNWDGTYRIAAVESVQKELENHKLGKYNDKRKKTVVEWVALRPII